MRHKLDPKTRRLQRPIRQKPTYKIIAVGIYDDLAEALDRAADGLVQAGFKANRSFVVQALARRLQQEMEGLPDEAILKLFVDKYVRRPLASASRRTSSSTETDTTPRDIEAAPELATKGRRRVRNSAR